MYSSNCSQYIGNFSKRFYFIHIILLGFFNITVFTGIRGKLSFNSFNSIFLACTNVCSATRVQNKIQKRIMPNLKTVLDSPNFLSVCIIILHRCVSTN